MTPKPTNWNELHLAECEVRAGGPETIPPPSSGAGQDGDRKVDTHLPNGYLRTPEDVAAYLNAATEKSAGDPQLLMKAFRRLKRQPRLLHSLPPTLHLVIRKRRKE